MYPSVTAWLLKPCLKAKVSLCTPWRHTGGRRYSSTHP